MVRLKKLIEDLNLISEITACREKYYATANEFLKNIDVKVIDQSGYYDNSRLYDIIPINDCVLPTTNDIKYIIDTSPTKNYSIAIDKWEYQICIDNEKCNIRPTIMILSRYVNDLIINDEFTDGALSFKIEKVSYTIEKSHKQLIMTYSIINNSKSYISISTDNVSLYLDSTIMTGISPAKIELLPKSKKENQQLVITEEPCSKLKGTEAKQKRANLRYYRRKDSGQASMTWKGDTAVSCIELPVKQTERNNVDAGKRYFLNAQDKTDYAHDRFIFAINKLTENTNMTVGIASKYTIDGIQKTLFDSKEYSLKRLAGFN